MKRLALAALVLAAAIPAVGAPDKDAVRKDLEKEYARYDQSVLKGMDALADWCEQRLAPDFTIDPGKGKAITRAEFIAQTRELAKKPDPAWKGAKSQKTAIDSLDLDGADVTAKITSRSVFLNTDTAGRYGPKNKDHELTITSGFRETWTRTDGGWKIRKSVPLESSMLVDGKAPAAK